MPVDEARLRDEMCLWGRSLFERGLTPGASGNLSARLDDGFLVTPTNACLGFLDPTRLSKLDRQGRHASGDPPTKEVPLHVAMYDARPGAAGVVHLHSIWATALSCLSELDPADALPPVTPYVVMRVGRVPVIPYMRPGLAAIREPVLGAARDHAAILLANHGPVVSAPSFEAAVFAAEEIEEAAKLFFILRGRAARTLSAEQVAELEAAYKLR